LFDSKLRNFDSNSSRTNDTSINIKEKFQQELKFKFTLFKKWETVIIDHIITVVIMVRIQVIMVYSIIL